LKDRYNKDLGAEKVTGDRNVSGAIHSARDRRHILPTLTVDKEMAAITPRTKEKHYSWDVTGKCHENNKIFLTPRHRPDTIDFASKVGLAGRDSTPILKRGHSDVPPKVQTCNPSGSAPVMMSQAAGMSNAERRNHDSGHLHSW
jgi:hypothetical protein